MDSSSLSLQLQQAWLLTQLHKLPPPPPSDPLSSSTSASSLSSPEPWRSHHSSPVSWPDLHSELSSLSDSLGFSNEGPPFPPPYPSSGPWGASPAAPAAVDDDVLMDPVLDFINDLLMDEQMEDRKCMHQECTAYQAIVNGFYEILGEESSSTDPSSSPAGNELGDDYSWIDEILVADPMAAQESAASAASSPSPLESSSASSAEQDIKPWSVDSPSSGFSRSSPQSTLSTPDPRVSIVPTQGYSTTPLVNDSPGPFLHDASFSALQNMKFPDAMLASGNSLPRNEEQDAKFRRVRSEELDYNSSLYPLAVNGNMSDNGGYKRATSDKVLDMRRHSQEEVRSFHGNNGHANDNSSVHLNGGNIVGSQGFEGSLVKKGRGSNDFQSRNNGMNPSNADDKISFVQNENLNAEKCAKFYREWMPSVDCLSKKKDANSNGSSVKRSERPEPVDLRALLVSCAQAVAGTDLRKANDLVQEIRQHASPHGSAAQRLAHYFTEGLVARLSGTGPRLYTAMSNNRPSAAMMLKAYHLMVQVCPFVRLSHFFANQTILKVAEGASRLHIVDYGILYGVQWPCLISALAERKGGPPFLRITGIEFPQPGLNPAERVEETGRRLAEYARTYNVPFKYQAIAKKWEDVEPASLNLKQGEVLVVNCIHRLRHLMDETVLSSSPRRKVLNRMRSMNPDIVTIAVMNAGFNAPFFVSRFREALYHFSSKFDMIDTTVDSDNQERLMIERECMGRDILNIVACEGPERVERPETYRQWQARFQRAGFELLPLNQAVVSKARSLVKACYHKDYGVDDDSKWMLAAWKGRIVEALSAWKPSASASVK